MTRFLALCLCLLPLACLAQSSPDILLMLYAIIDEAYRENMMMQHFMDEFNSLQDQRIMGIYGSAHTALGSMHYAGTVSNMATQLQDGSVQRMPYRADGQVWKGTLVTRQFLAE